MSVANSERPMTPLRAGVMDACLALSVNACALFDAVEADEITPAVAVKLAGMGRSINEIALALQTIVLTER